MLRRCARAWVVLLLIPVYLRAQPADPAALGQALEPFLAALSGRDTQVAIDGKLSLPEGGTVQDITLRIERSGPQSLRVIATHRDYALHLERSADKTVLWLLKHQVAFVGTGPTQGNDTLAPLGLTGRLISDGTQVFTYVSLLGNANGAMAAMMLINVAGLHSADGKTFTSPNLQGARLILGQAPGQIQVQYNATTLSLARSTLSTEGLVLTNLPADVRIQSVQRAELERLVVRGLRRMLEVAAPSAKLTNPPRLTRSVANGQLKWVQDQRLILLAGTPQQIGRAHGLLMPAEIRRCADSALYMIGLGETVNSGRWFLDDLRDARRRLEPFIPEDHQVELNAMADAARIDREEIALANVFPELFHCSGFAVFGGATVDGKLYHGRVLDYMTKIGLQDAAGTFIIAPQGKHPFANVGYAGFVGCVSGMNDQQISLGEMGGAGQGNWDGVPMATLMRRALEECDSLEQVKKLWSDSKRTCEYYYVFADGKIPDAVAVSATPQSIEFVRPGESHPRIGEGVKDSVLVSGDTRLQVLRQRVQEQFGTIDAAKAMNLMSRPVAMTSNLHNVLFVPQDGLFYVANADHNTFAAARPYVRFDLRQLIQSLPPTSQPAPAASQRP